jgi:hypothetical protein
MSSGLATALGVAEDSLGYEGVADTTGTLAGAFTDESTSTGSRLSPSMPATSERGSVPVV